MSKQRAEEKECLDRVNLDRDQDLKLIRERILKLKEELRKRNDQKTREISPKQRDGIYSEVVDTLSKRADILNTHSKKQKKLDRDLKDVHRWREKILAKARLVSDEEKNFQKSFGVFETLN